MPINDLILGIDPGSRTTGYAILEKKNGVYSALRCDVIKLDDLPDHADRLQRLFQELSVLVKQYQPRLCAVETPVFGKDPQAMLKLGRAQAACMLAITTNGFKVAEYLPKEVKKSVTGNGNASKEQVAIMLGRCVKLPAEKLKKDATDALAVAWCHYSREGSLVPSSQNNRHKNNQKDPWLNYLEKNPNRLKTKT
jgi:crossover junction endodeoxyribonuclease RuvC